MKQHIAAVALGIVLGLGAWTLVPSVSAAPPGWSEPMLLETSEVGSADFPIVGVDGSGNAVSVWRQFDGTNYDLWTNYYARGVGWSGPRVLRSGPFTSVFAPHLDVNSSGSAAVLWLEDSDNDGNDDVLASIFSPTIGWGAITTLDAMPDDADEGDIALDTVGSVIATWQQGPGGFPDDIYVSRYTSAGGWSAPTAIDVSGADATEVHIEMDSAGNAIVVWLQDDDGVGDPDAAVDIWARRYSAFAAAWEAAFGTLDGETNAATDASLAVDDSGDAIVAWEQDDGDADATDDANFALRAAGGAWSVNQTADQGLDAVVDPKVAAYGAGEAIIVWEQDDGDTDTINDIQARREVAGGLLANFTLDTGGNSAFNPEVAADASGNAIVVWEQNDGVTDSTWANRYAVGSGWTGAVTIDSVNMAAVNQPQIGMNAAGDAVAVWEQSDGLLFNVWAAVFSAPDLTAPALSVTSPTSGATVTTSTVTVSGTTEAGATVTVNGLVADASTGSFSIALALVPGANTITVRATDAADNAATPVVLTVTYNDPVPGLQQDITDLEDQLNSTENDLATTKTDLDTAEAQLQDARNRIGSLESNAMISLVLAIVALLLALLAMVLGMRRKKPAPEMAAAPMAPAAPPTPPAAPPSPPGGYPPPPGR